MFKFTTVAFLGLFFLGVEARAWEVVGNTLPIFAMQSQGSTAGLSPSGQATPKVDDTGLRGSLGAPGFSAASPFGSIGGDGARSSFRIGKEWLVGIDQRSSAVGPQGFGGFGALGAGAAGFNSANVRFGYDLGAFKPFVSAGFANWNGAAAAAPLAQNPLGPSTNPFSPQSGATRVGAGFEYSLSEKSSISLEVSAVQARPEASGFAPVFPNAR